MHHFKRNLNNKLIGRCISPGSISSTRVFSTLNKMRNNLPSRNSSAINAGNKLMSKNVALEQLSKIQEQRLLERRIKQKRAENENQVITTAPNSANTIIYKNERLPLPPERKYDKKPEEKSIKETKIITDQAELSNILNMLGITNTERPDQKNIDKQLENLNIPPVKPDEQIKQAENKIDITEPISCVISLDELTTKIESMVYNIQKNYFTNTQYNFGKLIQFIYNIYPQYYANPMAISVICRGISKANMKQMVKLPEDKIGPIVQYIIDEIKIKNNNK